MEFSAWLIRALSLHLTPLIQLSITGGQLLGLLSGRLASYAHDIKRTLDHLGFDFVPEWKFLHKQDLCAGRIFFKTESFLELYFVYLRIQTFYKVLSVSEKIKMERSNGDPLAGKVSSGFNPAQRVLISPHVNEAITEPGLSGNEL